ncbi:MAG: ribosomal protein S18 acetylase RimI-like enzyme [Enterobacterales bacterium]|jgi:ribosomal protein S18 acetylase RimI-like enzyme
MKAIIRQANKSDAASLAKFAEHTFRDAFIYDNLVSNIDMHCLQSFSSQIQQQEILNSNIVTFLAEVDQDLVGFAQLKLDSSVDCVKANKPAELYRLYIATKHHGTGLAHKIIQEVLRSASEAKNDYIWLGVWEHNPRAIAFYQKYGFRMIGEHIFNLGLDPQRDLIMVTDIGIQIPEFLEE